MSVEVVSKHSSLIGEGPVWEEKSATLIYVDIDRGDVHRYNPVTKEDTKSHVGEP